MRNFKKFWKIGKTDFNTEFFDYNNNGELIVKEGNYQYNINSLIQKYGTSLEIVFPFVLENRLTRLINIFNKHIKNINYKGKFFYHYPMKVNQNKEIVLPLVSVGANIEVSSKNELWLVEQLWQKQHFNKKLRVICNGPKTEDYLELIYKLKQQGLNIIPIIEDINEYYKIKKFKGNIGIRVAIKVNIKSRWNKKVDRYGLSEKEILSLGKIHNLKILHYHLGSQTEKSEDILKPFRKATDLFVKLKQINPSIDTINIGGGVMIPYEKRKTYSIDNLAKRIITYLHKTVEKHEIQAPNIIVEWGRYIVAPAQISIFNIVSEKLITNSNAHKWYIINGSFMNDLLDTWAIHQKWHIVPVNYANIKKFTRVWLAGMSCDSDDKYSAGSYLLLPKIEDLSKNPLYIAIFDTGAYQDAFASHHCLLSSPAKIIARNGQVTIARKRETAKDIGKLFGW